MPGFQYSGTAYTESRSFLRSVGQEGDLSVARSVCDPVVESDWETVRSWDSRTGRQLDGVQFVCGFVALCSGVPMA
jgi:hypothetical protein